MENQSWWEPQKGPPSHPGTGKQGHIHVETCFPLYQRFSGTETIAFDITVRMHNLPGEMKDLVIDSYGDFRLNVARNVNWRCPTADCARTFHAEFPLDQMQYSGLHALHHRGVREGRGRPLPVHGASLAGLLRQRQAAAAPRVGCGRHRVDDRG